jgi:hypothetical protein
MLSYSAFLTFTLIKLPCVFLHFKILHIYVTVLFPPHKFILSTYWYSSEQNVRKYQYMREVHTVDILIQFRTECEKVPIYESIKLHNVHAHFHKNRSISVYDTNARNWIREGHTHTHDLPAGFRKKDVCYWDGSKIRENTIIFTTRNTST